VAALAVDAPVSRELRVAAEAVALGRAGDPAAAADRFAEADEAFGHRQGGFRRALVRMLVAPAALADGWGDPLAWLRETLATFEAKDLGALAQRTRAILREAGAPIPRPGRGHATPVPAALAAMGITGREVDVLKLVVTGATNREIGEQLFISVRTVDKHVERLLQKAGSTRAGLAEVARAGGLLPT
jgi:DNA-binding CsgD family transcriptional regulator